MSGLSRLGPQCVICGTPLDGSLSYLFRLVGIKRSSRNPKLCNRCNAHVEEGRIVEITVLFVDLSSFTELTHKLGPEYTHEVVDAFLQMATDVLVKHDAFIDKYMGDAVMAFFNMPIQRGDHIVQAVAAAVEFQNRLPMLRERFGLDLQARVGIASGWALVGRLGSGDGKDYTAIGDVVNLAARLQKQAQPGEIVIDESAYEYLRLATDFPAVPTESLSLKGFQGPMESYRLNSGAGLPPHVSLHSRAAESSRGGTLRMGAVVFAVLGAPCAAYALLSPLAVALGWGALFGATSVLWTLDKTPIRLPLLILATVGALANLYTVWGARKFRLQSLAARHVMDVTKQQHRRTLVVVGSAIATLMVVAYELYAHASYHETPF